ncbi:MAG: ABC transporter permease [Firmicutes bacterium]|nr:ABC transporter permease [Bacillota bacterium]
MLSIIKLRLMRLRNDYFVFVFMTILALGLSFVMGSSQSGNYKPTVPIVNSDSSEYSNLFIEELKNSKNYNFTLTDYDNAYKKVDEGKVLMALIINKGFQRDINNNKMPKVSIIKTKDDIEILTTENLIKTNLAKLKNNVNIAKVTTDYISGIKDVDKKNIFNKAYDLSLENWEYKRPMSVTRKTITDGKWSEFDNFKHIIIGFTLFFSMYTIVFGIGEILNERKYNTWQRQIVSPLSKGAILGGNMVITFMIGIIQVGVLIMASKYLFNVDWGSSFLGIMTVSISFVFTVTSLGLFLSGIVKTHSQLAAISPVILTSTSMIGGAMWPLEIVNSKILLFLANLTPQKWAIEAMEEIAMYNGSFNSVIYPSLIIIFMGIIYFILGIKLIRFE